mmetsp:Transcript_12313/g.26107  ORF Transcript_12313/g.26107 Transcript_12313/m.26107 type:complete len:469 (-) Transcript_12313:652-2058(-)
MKTITPQRTVVAAFSTSQNIPQQSGFEYDSGEYILSIASPTSSLPQHHLSTCVAAALSNRSIVLYDTNSGQVTQRIDGVHDGPISEIHFFPWEYYGLGNDTISGNDGPGANNNHTPLIISASQDGTIKVFDIRSNRTSQAAIPMRLNLAKEQALSVSLGYGGTLAAVGTNKARISFFDLRYASGHNPSGNLMGSYVDSHTEEVTQVRFQTVQQPGNNVKKTVLATASEDGLLTIHDPSQPSEEAALLSVLNVGIPLRSVGFFGPAYEGAYALTGNETMSVWHWDSAQKVSDVGGYGLRGMLSDVVGNAGWKSAVASIGMNTDDAASAVEYLVGCTWSVIDEVSATSMQMPSVVSSPALHLLAGNSHGDGFVFRMDADQIKPIMHLKGGHKGCIRDFCWVNGNNNNGSTNRLITGGEDARLCEWDFSGKEHSTPKSRDERGRPISGRSARRDNSKNGGADGKKKFGSPY